MTLAMAGLMQLGPAIAEDAFRRLSDRQIRTRFVGRELGDGAHWRYLFRPDGTMVSVTLGRRGTGTWHVAEGRLCMSGGPGSSPCYEVWMEGEEVQLRPDTGLAPEEGVLRRP